MIRSGRLSSLLLNLALLAFLVRSLVPAGFMPTQNAHDTYPLVICSGYGPVTIHVTADKLPHAPGPIHKNLPCPYALALAQGIWTNPPALPLPSAAELVQFQLDSFLFLNQTFKNYFSQGPPEFFV